MSTIKTMAIVMAAAVSAAACADDTARLQALLDSGKGRVEFPDGTFVVSKPLVISSDTHLVCSPRTVVRLAAASSDGRKRALLVTDYRGKGLEVAVEVKGIPADAKVSARIHDYTHDCAPAEFTFVDGKLVLKKTDAQSAAFLVTFE